MKLAVMLLLLLLLLLLLNDSSPSFDGIATNCPQTTQPIFYSRQPSSYWVVGERAGVPRAGTSTKGAPR